MRGTSPFVVAAAALAAFLGPLPASSAREPDAIRNVRLAERRVAGRLGPGGLEVEVEDHLFNPGSGVVEATVIVPVPDGAAPDGLTLEIGGERVAGDLIDRESAEEVYGRLFRRNRDPAILDYLDRTTYRLRVFPIPGRSTAVVTYRYSVAPQRVDGGLLLRIPLRAPGFSDVRAERVSVDLDLRVDGRLRTVYSPTLEFDVDRRGVAAATARWRATHATLDRDAVVLVGTDEADLGVVVTTAIDNDGRRYFLAAVEPPELPQDGDGTPARDLIFAVDSSASVARADLDETCRGVERALAGLTAQDRFDVLPFSTDGTPVFGRLVAGTPENVDRARAALARLEPMGRTDLRAALVAMGALAESARHAPVAMLASDGHASLGDRGAADLAKLAATTEPRFRIAPVGFGERLDLATLERLARETGGDFEVTGPGEGVSQSFARLFDRVSRLAMTDFRATAEGSAGVVDLTHDVMPIVREGRRIVLVGRYRNPGKALLRLTARRAGVRLEREVLLDLGEGRRDRGALARIWAARRIGDLLDRMRRRETTDVPLRAEVEALGRRYGIVTPYTDYLAIEPSMRQLLRGMQVQLDRVGGLEDAAADDVAPEPLRDPYGRSPEVELLRRVRELASTDRDAGLAFDDLTTTRALRAGSALLVARKDGLWTTPDLLEAEIPQDAVVVGSGSPDHLRLVRTMPALRDVLVSADRLLVAHEGRVYVVR